MNFRYYPYVCALMALAISASCTGKKAASPDCDTSEIHNFEVKQTVKTIERDYLCEDADMCYGDSIPVYSTIKIAVEWPEKMGRHDISRLQDSLIYSIFDTTGISIDQAILASTERPEDIDLFKMKRVDSIHVSEINRVLIRDIIASVITFSPRFIVYQIMTSTYSGGAHGITESKYLNYDMAASRTITSSDIFKAGTQDSVLQAVKDGLMTKFNVSSMKELQDKGIFADRIYVTNNFYLQGYDIVFHYNPYEIAPYAMGSIDIRIPYYQIQSCIKPEAVSMLSEAAEY